MTISAMLLAGCAVNKEREAGLALIEARQYEQGLTELSRAVEADPRNAELRVALTTSRARAVEELLGSADLDFSQRDFASSAVAYERVLGIEPNNRRAQNALNKLKQMRNMSDMLRNGETDLRRGDLTGAQREVNAILALDPGHQGALGLQQNIETIRQRTNTPYPQLRSRMERPINLEFRDANLKVIFEVLSQASGLNFIFDKDLRPDLKATIFVRQVRIEDAVELLLQQNQLRRKVVNDNTVLIYPDSPQKQKDYQDLAMRTFYLTNMDANTALNLIKTMLKTRDVFVDERLNTLTMRDTPDAIRLAEKLFYSQDQSNPEVVMEVEVMEVNSQRIRDLGLQWPNTFTVLNDAGGTPTTLSQLKGLDDSSRIGINSSIQAKIQDQDTDVNTLASPVIRVSNREQARIHIGQRVPIISATSVPSTQGPVITESITYLDVGLKLEVQPVVHLNNEVAIKVALEVSNATPLAPTPQGTIPVQVDTRNAVTTLRLHDGETQILAGLMRNDKQYAANKIPGLGDIPGLGRLFGSNKDTYTKAELVLSITPRIIRNLPYQSPSDMEFDTGTESAMQVRPVDMSLGQLDQLPPATPPGQGEPATGQPAIAQPAQPMPAPLSSGQPVAAQPSAIQPVPVAAAPQGSVVDSTTTVMMRQ
ncbi:secretin N-terminal domain-containing protein [Pseudomonas schmalbachii]|uniref:Secretin and TonB N-terminal domain-containing protein n=1 Tax=Pseudomonas schmalbachii TaxID=2816993 RepID=A0ABS3TS58_9PSED|nr:secretin and TonB N-terminal domain-containing protein [Pseudomonas schmalbachii]